MVTGSPRDIGNDPFASFRFQAEIDNLVVSGFSEVSGLVIETEVESFREGGVNTRDWQLAGPAKFPTKLTLKRGLADANALWTWYRDIMAGRIKRKQVTIILMDYAGNEKWRWVFQKACPVKWSGPELRSKSTEIAFESIELIHKGILADDKSGLK
jgi:phage tail-like protein